MIKLTLSANRSKITVKDVSNICIIGNIISTWVLNSSYFATVRDPLINKFIKKTPRSLALIILSSSRASCSCASLKYHIRPRKILQN